MAYRIELKPSAVKELAALPREIRRRIGRAIDRLRDDPTPPGSKRLQGYRNLWRIRVGDYRIIYRVQKKQVLILVLRIRHRGDVYKIRFAE